MKIYNFRIVVEPDEHRWIAYCPALVDKGAATGGATREEAFENIREVLQMVVESLIELGVPVPEDALKRQRCRRKSGLWWLCEEGLSLTVRPVADKRCLE